MTEPILARRPAILPLLALTALVAAACSTAEEAVEEEAEPAAAGPASPGPAAPASGAVIGIGGSAGGKFGGRYGGKKVMRAHGGVSAARTPVSVPGLQDTPAELATTGPRIDRRLLLEDLEPVDAVDWEQVAEDLLEGCRPLPDEKPRDLFFRFWGDNPFELTVEDRLSTFGADVDTASYALARRYLEDGRLPEKAQVRTEEFLNYFAPDVPAPVHDTFAIALELGPSLFGEPGHELLRVALRGREVPREVRSPLALTFVADTSGSMREGGRMGLVQHALRLLVAQLDARDAVCIVGFSQEATVLVPMTSAGNRGLIETAISKLAPGGSTNAEGGLMTGFEQAALALDPQAQNRVVFLSDGVANVGETDQDRINERVAHFRAQGIYLNTVGVGMGNHDDDFLEQLADKGDGIANYVDSSDEARRALVENFTGAFEPIARDVKIQVEFDPNQVERYRLLGYENRAIADEDFRDDAVDAGEIGAGHQVVALYEIVRTGTPAAVDPLVTVRVRYKAPHGQQAEEASGEFTAEIERSLTAREASGSFLGTTAGFRRSALVAQLAELLRRSVHAEGEPAGTLVAEAERLAPELADPDFDAYVELTRKAAALLAEAGRGDELVQAVDALRHTRYRIAVREASAAGDPEAGTPLPDVAALEDQVRTLVRERVEGDAE